ncbi:unnamed protein product, partial [Amoebophrya sp. A25]|eukprot:GSA25T00002391001.1
MMPSTRINVGLLVGGAAPCRSSCIAVGLMAGGYGTSSSSSGCRRRHSADRDDGHVQRKPGHDGKRTMNPLLSFTSSTANATAFLKMSAHQTSSRRYFVSLSKHNWRGHDVKLCLRGLEQKMKIAGKANNPRSPFRKKTTSNGSWRDLQRQEQARRAGGGSDDGSGASISAGLPAVQTSGASPFPSFQEFPLRREVQTALLKMSIRVPTKIQMSCIPRLLMRKKKPGEENGMDPFQSVMDNYARTSWAGAQGKSSLLLVAGTGSGKTVAYLAPLIHNLLEEFDPHVHPIVTQP